LKMPSAGVNGRGRRKTSGLIDQSSDLIAFLVAGSPETLAPTRCSLAHRDRVSRFTANAALNGTVAGSELILYQDPQSANAEHYRGALNSGNDGKLHFTTGEHFAAPTAQLLADPRGKIHRINSDGSVPTDSGAAPRRVRRPVKRLIRHSLLRDNGNRIHLNQEIRTS
jgi:hypothetical protein